MSVPSVRVNRAIVVLRTKLPSTGMIRMMRSVIALPGPALRMSFQKIHTKMGDGTTIAQPGKACPG